LNFLPNRGSLYLEREVLKMNTINGTGLLPATKSKPSLFSTGEGASRDAYRRLTQAGIDFQLFASSEEGCPILLIFPQRFTGLDQIQEWLNSRN
jgi:hypothetical protein